MAESANLAETSAEKLKRSIRDSYTPFHAQ